jgi:ABC-type nitrate/sulfonate/bicarbonate transport system substrate-binding protein
MSMRLSIRAFIAAALLVTLARGTLAQTARPVTIGLASTSFATAAPRIAKEIGLFEKRGLDAKFVVMDNANAATSALIAKSVDFALSGPGELVVAQGRGQKVVLIANAYAGLSGTVVLAKSVADKLGVAPDAPIKQRLKALDGLVLGSTSATGVYTVSIRGAASAVGANVRFAYMAQPAMTAALESGAIQGFVGGAPFWSVPLLKGSGVLWISGPKGELPAEFTPSSAANLQAMRDFAEANAELMKTVAAVFAELDAAITDRPAEVKAALGRLYRDLDASTLDLLFNAESAAWKAKPLTAKDIAVEIAYVKSSGAPLPQIDNVDPKSMIFP